MFLLDDICEPGPLNTNLKIFWNNLSFELFRRQSHWLYFLSAVGKKVNAFWMFPSLAIAESRANSWDSLLFWVKSLPFEKNLAHEMYLVLCYTLSLWWFNLNLKNWLPFLFTIIWKSWSNLICLFSISKGLCRKLLLGPAAKQLIKKLTFRCIFHHLVFPNKSFVHLNSEAKVAFSSQDMAVIISDHLHLGAPWLK